MKILDIDWLDFLNYLERWEALSTDVREAALRLGPSEAADASEYGSHADDLVAAGMLTYFKDGKRVRPAQAFQPALKVLRLMQREPVLQHPSKESIASYSLAVLTSEERYAISGHDPWRIPQAFDRTVGSLSYLDGFLSKKDAAKWEESNAVDEYDCRTERDKFRAFESKHTAQDLRRLLKILRDGKAPLTFVDLLAAAGRMSARRFANAVWAGLRYALCCPGFQEGLRPALGLHPSIQRRLCRPIATAPAHVEPDNTFCEAWEVDDLVQLLIFCGEPRRLRSSDNRRFAKAETELAERLLPLPPHLRNWQHRTHRVDVARDGAERRGYVTIAGARGRTYRLELTEAGRDWLALPGAERARLYLAPIVERIASEDAELCQALSALTGPVVLRDFARYQAETNNPLLAQPGRRKTLYGPPPDDNELEELWAARLQDLMLRQLAPNGGLRLGEFEGSLTVEVTEPGRFLLGLTSDLDWPDVEEASSIVVQPDFDIVFLAPSASLEASLARFAERVGQAPGSAFRLTRASVQAAVRAGVSAEAVLATLAQASSASLPTNVTTEIEGWCSQCVVLTWDPTQLLRFADPEAALRALSAARGKLESLTPTVLALTDPKHRTSVTNACRKAGVFIDLADEATQPKTPRRKRRSRSRYW